MGLFWQVYETMLSFFFGIETLPDWGISFLSIISLVFIAVVLFWIVKLLFGIMRMFFGS